MANRHSQTANIRISQNQDIHHWSIIDTQGDKTTASPSEECRRTLALLSLTELCTLWIWIQVKLKLRQVWSWHGYFLLSLILQLQSDQPLFLHVSEINVTNLICSEPEQHQVHVYEQLNAAPKSDTFIKPRRKFLDPTLCGTILNSV